jgi:hypothetical protein
MASESVSEQRYSIRIREFLGQTTIDPGSG